jgi:hypothetical protein
MGGWNIWAVMCYQQYMATTSILTDGFQTCTKVSEANNSLMLIEKLYQLMYSKSTVSILKRFVGTNQKTTRFT